MKRTTLLALAALPLLAQAQLPTTVVDSNIRYCESTLPYRDGVLIANFGTEQLNPLNTEGKGYILYFDGKTTKTISPADGHLNAPKGMYLDGDDFLFIADVNKVVVYDLNAPTQPQTLQMPEGDLFVNDMAAADGTLYISVTNTDRIYSIDLNTAESHLKEWASVPGPNGIVIKDGAMYVASYPADGTTKADNVIYRIADLKNPQPEAYINIPGQYDGISFSADGEYVYFTNWQPAGISKMNLKTRKVTELALDLKTPLIGPADISVAHGNIYIPDLPNSRVVIIKE